MLILLVSVEPMTIICALKTNLFQVNTQNFLMTDILGLYLTKVAQDAMLSLGSEPKELHNVPISVSFVENATVGIYGEFASRMNMLKSLILQMMSLHSYDELKIMLLTDETEADEWNFVRPIPHFWNDDKTIRFFATNGDETKELSA